MNELWNSARVMVASVLTTYPYSIFSWTAVAGVSLYLIKRCFGSRGGVCYSKARLDGKTAIITGANTGIGLETAVDFAQRNGRVILACRSKDKGEAAVELVKKRSGNNDVLFVQLDLSSLESVRQFCSAILSNEQRIDVLVNNAGLFCNFSTSVDGYEMQFAVNHLSHFLLTNLLLDKMKQAPSARIVIVSSEGYQYGKIDFNNLHTPDDTQYKAFNAYAQSKLANIIFTRSLSKKLQNTQVTVNAVHPGKVYTEIARNVWFLRIVMPLFKIFLKSPWQGAQTSIYCAVSEDMEGVSGQYLADCKFKKLTNPQATDDAIAERLWEVSSEMVGLDD
ncbi:retinol dehydrogenase 11-like [Halichondria panicea]|uniref:retinol dehydrogenase 11-like n=1 Tax=Halichondria panicea TaxID=6063 RepID=UPI00312BB811